LQVWCNWVQHHLQHSASYKSCRTGQILVIRCHVHFLHILSKDVWTGFSATNAAENSSTMNLFGLNDDISAAINPDVIIDSHWVGEGLFCNFLVIAKMVQILPDQIFSQALIKFHKESRSSTLKEPRCSIIKEPKGYHNPLLQVHTMFPLFIILISILNRVSRTYSYSS
jgi:hypothetical protein